MNITFGNILLYASSLFGLFTSFYFLILLIENKKKVRVKKSTEYKSVTIIVPAYNEEKTIKKTIDSLLALKYPKDLLEIIIVDDGSKDRTLEIARKYEKENNNIKVIHQKNSGKGVALNNAINQAKGDFVGALDADSFVDAYALQHIMTGFHSEKVAAVTPSMMIHKPKSFLGIIQQVEFVLGVFLRKIFSFAGSIHVTPGPFSIFRKSFFQKYGGYDEDNITEDIEVALRIQSKGYLIENSIDGYVYTTEVKKFTPLLKQRLRWYLGFFRNIKKYKELFSKKHGNLGMIILPASFISVGLAIIVFLYTLGRTVRSISNIIRAIYHSGWDYFRHFTFNFEFFYMINNITFLVLFTLTVSILIMLIANNFSGKIKGLWWRFIVFSGVYIFLFSIWWLLAFIYDVRGKKIKWGDRFI